MRGALTVPQACAVSMLLGSTPQMPGTAWVAGDTAPRPRLKGQVRGPGRARKTWHSHEFHCGVKPLSLMLPPLHERLLSIAEEGRRGVPRQGEPGGGLCRCNKIARCFKEVSAALAEV